MRQSRHLGTSSRRALGALLALAWACPIAVAASERPEWVGRSDENAYRALGVISKFNPEAVARLGVEGFDDKILDLNPALFERSQAATREAISELETLRAAETDSAVRQDLDILLDGARDALEGSEMQRKHFLPYFDVAQTVFLGVRGLLDDQVASDRRPAAVARLKRYAGMEEGYKPLTELAVDRTKERMGVAGLLGPSKAEVEKTLGNSAFFVDGVGKLFQKYGLQGWQEAHERLASQIQTYDAWTKKEILPRARTDFRLPPEVYAFTLRQIGVEIPPDELASRARVGFMEIRNEMQALAPLVAKEKGLAEADYRAVIRALKKQQLVGEAILPHYQKRMKELEAIIHKEAVATLPEREAVIRLASEAESASIPAPHMTPPRLVGNTGEKGEFVLPLRVPTAAGASGPAAMKDFDDFTFDAASWTLSVHEGRPGHEMQFAALVERGVSLARAVFAFNSVNVEGWALYTEAEMKPYLPLDGQLISLQHRLMRAARAFLDPDLQAGRIQPEEAVRFLMDQVVLSEPMARQEVERYTFKSPGQATSYFYGYTEWMRLKAETELALSGRFNRRRFHDFILSQGLLPPSALSKALREEFIPAQQAAGL